MKTIFICLLAVMTAAAAFCQTGTIRELTGEVELKTAGSANFVAARPGSQVAQDTIVSTGFRSTAIIVVGSNIISVRPLTRLTLAEITRSSGAEDLNINLQAGRVRVEVKPPAGARASATVRSPSATASVRGTIFEMDTVNLNVYEGKVLFKGNDELNVPVFKGSSSSIALDGSSQDPVSIAESELMPPEPVGMGEAGEAANSSSPPVSVIDFDVTW